LSQLLQRKIVTIHRYFRLSRGGWFGASPSVNLLPGGRRMQDETDFPIHDAKGRLPQIEST
jgi:hypothetical protein